MIYHNLSFMKRNYNLKIWQKLFGERNVGLASTGRSHEIDDLVKSGSEGSSCERSYDRNPEKIVATGEY